MPDNNSNTGFKYFLNKRVNVQASSGSFYIGTITNYDDFGIHFFPEDETLSETFITWADIKKVILVKEETSYTHII
ncbi:MAG: hypothetical protein KAH86_08205 [Methanosarcinales archaeon]|nr:hypothetical protein [Methanosarcinales archaeon]